MKIKQNRHKLSLLLISYQTNQNKSKAIVKKIPLKNKICYVFFLKKHKFPPSQYSLRTSKLNEVKLMICDNEASVIMRQMFR